MSEEAFGSREIVCARGSADGCVDDGLGESGFGFRVQESRLNGFCRVCVLFCFTSGGVNRGKYIMGTFACSFQ